MNPALLMLLTFLGVVLGVVGVYSILSDLFLRDRARFSQRVDEEFRHRLRDQARKSALFKNKGAAEAEVLATEDVQPGLQQRFAVMVEQSGLRLTPGRLVGIMACTGLILGGVGLLFRGSLLAARSRSSAEKVVTSATGSGERSPEVKANGL